MKKTLIVALLALTGLLILTLTISTKTLASPCLSKNEEEAVCIFSSCKPKPNSEKKIVINLSQQRLYAYEGDCLVFYTKVSTGLPSMPTPTGTFRIYQKLRITRMRGPGYDTPDVPFTQFYSGSYALHGAYWHNDFGQVRSHGCVNLSLGDAEWLFNWTLPQLPENENSIFSDNGTVVEIQE